MSDFIGHSIAGGVIALVLVAIFYFLSEKRGLGIAILLIFSSCLAYDGHVALGFAVALLIIWAVRITKTVRQQK